MSLMTADRFRITQEGGIAVQMVASTTIVRGNVIVPTTAGTALQVEPIAAGEDNPCGIAYEDAVSGQLIWIVILGIADVLFGSSITPVIRYHVYVPANGGETGRASCQSSVNTVRHWGEIGHCIESGAQGGLARCLLHFN